MAQNTTQFPINPRRDDPHGHMVVWAMLQFLRDAFDRFQTKFLSGAAVVLSGNTSVVVAIGGSLSTYQVELTPTTDPGGRYWVNNKTSTQFQINLSAAAPVGNAAFDWIAKGA